MHPRPDWHFKWRGKSPSSIPRRAGFCVSQHFRVVQDGSKAATNSFPGWKKTPPRRRPDMESFLFLGLSLSLRRFLEGITFQRKKGEDERGVVLFWRGKCQTGEAKSAKYQHVRNINVRLVKKPAKICRLFLTKAVSLQTSSNPARDTG